MPHVSRVKVQGFRSIADVDLPMSQRTVLIGPNGAGKSNLLTALRLVKLSTTRNLGVFVAQAGGANALLHYGAAQTPSMRLELDFDQGEGRQNAYRTTLGFAAERLVFEEERAGYRKDGGEWSWVDLGSGHYESALPEATHSTAKATAWCLRQLEFYHFHDTSHTSQLRTHARAADDRILRSNGSNLAAFLSQLENSDEADDVAAFKRIERWMRRIAPALRTLQPTPVENGHMRLVWTDARGETFGPEHLSDGTLRALALVSALSQPAARRKGFMHIDEPELGLHPAALSLVAALIRTASVDTQIMVSTQSPALLNEFDPEDVVVVEWHDGASTFSRLDPAGLADWLKDYQLAELYDRNVLGGRP